LTNDKSELLPVVSKEILKCLGELVAKKEQCERRLNTSKNILEDLKERAMKGEDLF
jgi:chromosome segregation ATPase